MWVTAKLMAADGSGNGPWVGLASAWDDLAAWLTCGTSAAPSAVDICGAACRKL